MSPEPFTLHLGDCVEVMRAMPENSIDAIVTDPPYELGFMGKGWDASGIAYSVAMWREALRVLKPGGHLLAFGGSRTYHRMACAVEDAGFEIRDQIMWVYGDGMPKSRNIAKYDLKAQAAQAWAGFGTALKPAHEPIVMARKPLAGTVAQNVLAWGTGVLDIDGCRVPVDDASYARNCSGDRGHGGTRSAAQEGATDLHTGGGSAAAGRWPANLIHDGSAEVVALFPAQAGAVAPVHTRRADKFRTAYGAFAGNVDEQGSTFQGDSGSAARFFYCPKATRRDRNEGCEHMEKKPLLWSSGTKNPGSFQAEGTDKSSQNFHPTVKPTDLCAYLVRLVARRGAVVYDPFMGSGSTGKACMREGVRFVGSELAPEYMAIAQARIAREYARIGALEPAPVPQLDLFA
jgi:site-specific DNA-methyltransferase (adenine-specific)